MTTSKASTSPKTIVISHAFIYASLCIFVFALGAFITAYSIMGDLGFLGFYYPVQRVLLIMGGLIVLSASGNMWLDQPKWAKRYTQPKRYTQLRH